MVAGRKMSVQLNQEQPNPERRDVNLAKGLVLHEVTFDASVVTVREEIIHVINALAKHGATRHLLNSFEIVLAELLNNIVEHGYNQIGSGPIELSVSHVGGKLRIKTFDKGAPLPDLLIPKGEMHDLTVETADLPEGQFGWFLIRKLTRALTYHRDSAGNHFSMEIR